jgi:hypothetical protein
VRALFLAPETVMSKPRHWLMQLPILTYCHCLAHVAAR